MKLSQLLDERYVLDFEDQFDGAKLDESRWLPFYLPHWSSRERSAARFRLTGNHLELLIEADQEPWCPEFDGHVRVSNLQTGQFSGPVGSSIGQHQFTDGLVVRQTQENARLYTPRYGAFAVRARGDLDDYSMMALWMIGYEDTPDRSAEICIFEIFGKNQTSGSTRIGAGLHPFGDPVIRDDFEVMEVPIDSTEFHEYGVEWGPEGVTYYVDDEAIKESDQSPGYPMQFMLNVYDFSPAASKDASYPNRLVVDWFRAYRGRVS